jgi:hypothetical protein
MTSFRQVCAGAPSPYSRFMPQVLRRLPVKLIHGLDCTKAMPTN